MRRFYETNGWLPAPIPGKLLRNRRRKAVQYLGLAGGPGSFESHHAQKEIFALISVFAQIVKGIFNTKRALVMILREEDAVYIGADPESQPQFVGLD